MRNPSLLVFSLALALAAAGPFAVANGGESHGSHSNATHRKARGSTATRTGEDCA